MRLQELFESRVGDLGVFGPAPEPVRTKPKIEYNFTVFINGRKWKDCVTEREAMEAANNYYNRHLGDSRRQRVDVLPIKK
jgi:hypothetical protein